MNCGCRVANRQYEKEPDIEFCPLHSNAEGMRDALRLIHDVANEHICDLQAENGDWFTIEAESYAALHCEVTVRVDLPIAKKREREP